MSGAAWLAILAAYLAVHFAVYVVKLRHLPAFAAEGTIFGYHLCSAVAVTLGAIVLAVASRSSESIALLVAAVSAHGIYSISFLELWSSAEGGYSLDILRALKQARITGREVPIGELHAIGARKKGNRVRSLFKLRLVRDSDGRLELTPFGRCAGTLLSGIAWTANIVDLG
ncbi:MAG: hypothetical protein JOZ81_23305 [Chloroflexi bacterium]|nr:hypothetical protein [Chloroflexota bacterium]MBV9545791.1 hypothetical protein [Chloroflexota bacterium]